MANMAVEKSHSSLEIPTDLLLSCHSLIVKSMNYPLLNMSLVTV